jgi:hypothetical protein
MTNAEANRHGGAACLAALVCISMSDVFAEMQGVLVALSGAFVSVRVVRACALAEAERLASTL